MNPQELLRDLAQADVQMTIRGDKLHVVAPEGILTDELKATLRERKTELLMLLQRKVCWHCAGLVHCNCIICNAGLSLVGGEFTVKSGSCVACKGNVNP